MKRVIKTYYHCQHWEMTLKLFIILQELIGNVLKSILKELLLFLAVLRLNLINL